jgi:hypothetical protein
MSTRQPNSSRATPRARTIVERDAETKPEPRTPLQLARRLYEDSPLTMRRIGQILGVHPNSLPRIAKREGWKRRRPLFWRRGRLARAFHLNAIAAAAPGLSPAEAVRALAAKSPEESEKEREEIAGRVWKNAQVEISRKEQDDAALVAAQARAARLRAMDAHVIALEELAHVIERLVKSRAREGKGRAR